MRGGVEPFGPNMVSAFIRRYLIIDSRAEAIRITFGSLNLVNRQNYVVAPLCL